MRLRAFAPILALTSTLSFAAASCGKVDSQPAAATATAVDNPTPVSTAEATASPIASQAAPAGLDPTERDPKVVLAGWAAALERRDWAEARRYWGDSGDGSGQSAQDFAAAWDKYRTLDVEVKDGAQEGAAGSLYYTAPVSLKAVEQDGAAVSKVGEVVLRRVNDVPGATAEQLRWHMESTTLRP
jgi:hypothetical protein